MRTKYLKLKSVKGAKRAIVVSTEVDRTGYGIYCRTHPTGQDGSMLQAA